MAILGHGGELGRELLQDRQSLAILPFRLRTLAQTREQEPQVVAAHRQVVAILGHGGELGRQGSKTFAGNAECRRGFHLPTQPILDHAHAKSRLGMT